MIYTTLRRMSTPSLNDTTVTAIRWHVVVLTQHLLKSTDVVRVVRAEPPLGLDQVREPERVGTPGLNPDLLLHVGDVDLVPGRGGVDVEAEQSADGEDAQVDVGVHDVGGVTLVQGLP